MPGSKPGSKGSVSALLRIAEWIFLYYFLTSQSKIETWFFFKIAHSNLHIFYGMPRFVRITILHFIATMATVALMPPPPETPPIAVPIVWGASLGTAFMLYAAIPALRM